MDMRIRGVGVDIVQLNRIRRLLRFSSRTLKWVLHPSEVNFFRRQRNKTEWLARFFSAKEAVFKSLGLTNFGAVGFRYVEIKFMNNCTAEATLYGYLKKSVHKHIDKIFVASTKLNTHIISQAISIKTNLP